MTRRYSTDLYCSGISVAIHCRAASANPRRPCDSATAPRATNCLRWVRVKLDAGPQRPRSGRSRSGCRPGIRPTRPAGPLAGPMRRPERLLRTGPRHGRSVPFDSSGTSIRPESSMASDRDSPLLIPRESSMPRSYCWESAAASAIRTMARYFQIKRSIFLASSNESTRMASASFLNDVFGRLARASLVVETRSLHIFGLVVGGRSIGERSEAPPRPRSHWRCSRCRTPRSRRPCRASRCGTSDCR